MRTTFLIILALVVGCAIGHTVARRRPILCDASSQVDIRAAGEYPVWRLDCRDGVQVILLD
jgi:hypothetical protein